MLKGCRIRAVKLGVAGACVVGAVQCAHAQSSVTLYGVLDASILYTNKSVNSKTGGNGGSLVALTDAGQQATRFGMRGVEDLGGGMKALFVLESGFSIANGSFSNGNRNLFGRQAYVGLSSDYGTLTAGLQYSPFNKASYYTEPANTSFFAATPIIGTDLTGVTGEFNQNALVYTSPEVFGLQGSVMLAMGGQAGDFQAGRQYSGSLVYNFKSLTLMAGFYSGNPGGPQATVLPSTVSFVGRELGASYKFGSLTVRANFSTYNVQNSYNAYVYSAGLMYSITPAVILDGAVYEIRDENNPNNHALLLSSSVQYLLSKATSVYGQIGSVTNHGTMRFGISVNNGLTEPLGTTLGVGIGIRHTF
ncbi:porin [Paraburkholderia sp. RP-4-7]|jgi:predicted porin|uniref:Porin n=1 Tax=Paraburkholderia polaris TaxID=2728848 RepID=A0A848IP09_9BURK|nr:porin [Paraburkholderia polaris]NMM01535.1 porin [Paraburkholderia polaris]